jgi:DNA topoisomerase IB
MSEVSKYGATKPKSQKEYKKMVKDVATIVSKQLGNTPTVALQSYIHPAVFAEWRV